MNIIKLFPALAIVLLGGCNYDFLNQATGNSTSSSQVTTSATESTSTVEPSPSTPPSTGGSEETVSTEETGESEELIACDPCQSERTIDLAWIPNEDATGYRIYFGSSSDAIDQLLSDLSDSSATFDPDAPAISYHAWYDIGLFDGDSVCFSIESYDSANTVTMLGSACGVLNTA